MIPVLIVMMNHLFPVSRVSHWLKEHWKEVNLRWSEVPYNSSESMLVLGCSSFFFGRVDIVFLVADGWVRRMSLGAGASLLAQRALGLPSTFFVRKKVVIGVEMVRTADSVATAGGSFHPGELNCRRMCWPLKSSNIEGEQ